LKTNNRFQTGIEFGTVILIELSNSFLDPQWNLHGHAHPQVVINDEGKRAMHEGIVSACTTFFVT
jgi:hypothetical protein